MTSFASQISSQAMAFPAQDRARLAEELLASLAPHEAAVEAAWDEALRQRIADIETGKVDLVPAEQGFRQVRAALRQ